MVEIRGDIVLPSHREPLTLVTRDHVRLVGELALPTSHTVAGTLITVHPLPTHGGFMDSHLFRKAANRLPALADLAVLRFNTRGTTSPHGTSEGVFDGGKDERWDLEAAIDYAEGRGLPNIWLVGWSFGTEVVLKYGKRHDVAGIILLSPPLHRTSEDELAAWRDAAQPVIVMVPELDDYLPPDAARERFSILPDAQLIAVGRARHLWVGERSTRVVLHEIVRRVNPSKLPLPESWDDGERLTT